MILVTGATGNIGRHLVRDLAASGGAGPVRALSRDPARAAFPAGVEAVAGDLARAADGGLATALSGVRSLFLVAGLAPEEPVLAAARDAGVGHVVLVSSLTVETHPRLWPARANAAVEERVRDSGLAWTILRPTQFASNALWWADAIRAHGTVRAPYGDVGLPTVHPADIAAVARAALLDPAGHAGRTYPVTGPERVTPRQQTAALAAALGRDLAFHEEPRRGPRPAGRPAGPGDRRRDPRRHRRRRQRRDPRRPRHRPPPDRRAGPHVLAVGRGERGGVPLTGHAPERRCGPPGRCRPMSR
jgi:uncharacterized protein YbjT (DUF2867 family)